MFCVACGAHCTVKPKNLGLKCPGRDGRQAGGVAALKRKVHGVQPLHQAALDHWGLVPLARRGEVLAPPRYQRLGCCSRLKAAASS